jgi:hypothetical protein
LLLDFSTRYSADCGDSVQRRHEPVHCSWNARFSGCYERDVSRYELRISPEKLLLHRPFHTDYEIELKNIESLEMGVREPQVVIWPRPASGLLPCKFAISAVLIPTKRDLHTLVQILEDKGIGHRFPPSGRGQYLKWLFFGRVSAHARDAFVTRRAALVMTLAGGASVIAGAWIYLGLLPKMASGRRADDVFLFAGLLVGFGLFRALRGARLLYAQLNRQEQ